jgi:hypothetical protein
MTPVSAGQEKSCDRNHYFLFLRFLLCGAPAISRDAAPAPTATGTVGAPAVAARGLALNRSHHNITGLAMYIVE